MAALNTAESRQERLLSRLIILSVALHVIVPIGARLLDWSPEPIVQEWSIETDLVSDADLGGATKTVIENAKKSEEVSVPTNMLPQLPKRITTKEQTQADEGLAPGEVVETDEDQKKEADKPEVDEKPEVSQPSDPDVANKVDTLDLLKRQALERLREQQKEPSRELKANESDIMPQIKDALAKGAASSSDQAGLFASAASRRYQSYLDRTIRRNYRLPETIKFLRKVENVILAIRINAQGRIISVEIEKSSGDESLDAYCIEAVKRSSPFEAPPKILAGKTIQLVFTP